jgi:hypothetical protein
VSVTIAGMKIKSKKERVGTYNSEKRGEMIRSFRIYRSVD